MARLPTGPNATPGDVGGRALGLAVAVTLAAGAAIGRPIAGAGAGHVTAAIGAPSGGYSDLFIPVILRGHERPFAALTALPGPTSTRAPTATGTPTRPPTRTPVASATPGPSPTATRPGGVVTYPRDPATIVVQVGWSDTEQPGAAWEEMNGTPFFTLYGDGRLIAGHALFDWEHDLYEGRVGEDQIQDWLQRLTYDVQFFTMEASYEHPDLTKYGAHLYVRFGTAPRDFRRVSVAGFARWLRDPLPDVADAERVRGLARLVKDLEAYGRRELATPYAAEAYTVISHEINGYAASPPSWRHSLDIAAISDSAPSRPDGGNVHGPPGHKRVDASLGAEVRAIVAEDARRDWPGLNLAAEYVARRRHFVVGVRPEVPGESFFLPDRLRDMWYRQD